MSGVDAVVRDVVEKVEKFGWTATGVLPTAEDIAVDPDFVPFTYTTGFAKSWERPELIITGLPPRTAHMIFWGIVELIESEGFEPVEGENYDGIVSDYPVRFREIADEEREVMVLTRNFYEGEPFRAMQVVWTDAKGRFPDDDGYSSGSQEIRA